MTAMSRKIVPVILCIALCFNEAAAQVITTICGDGTAGITPDGFPAVSSWIAGPGGANKGYVVAIKGSGFASTGNTIRFNGFYAATANSSDGTTLPFVVPTVISNFPSSVGGSLNVSIPVNAGVYNVTVTNTAGSSNSIPFTVF